MGSNRTPLLLGAMILVVGVWVADQFKVFSFVDNWGKESEAKLSKLTSDIIKLEDLILQGADASDKLAAYEQRSLPFKTDLARSEYQAWLVKLVSANDLLQSSVEVSPPSSITIKDGAKKREAFKRYGFSVNASGTLEQLSKFLFDFYSGGHLQKITTMSMNRSSGGRFTFSISGEAIGLNTSEREGTLTTARGARLAKSELQDYATIVRRNIFSREVGATLKLVNLSSITYDKSGVPEAWMKIGPKQSTKKLQRGETLTASVHEIHVIDIQPRSALLDVDGEILDLPIGKSIFEAMSAPEIAGTSASGR